MANVVRPRLWDGVTYKVMSGEAQVRGQREDERLETPAPVRAYGMVNDLFESVGLGPRAHALCESYRHGQAEYARQFGAAISGGQPRDVLAAAGRGIAGTTVMMARRGLDRVINPRGYGLVGGTWAVVNYSARLAGLGIIALGTSAFRGINNARRNFARRIYDDLESTVRADVAQRLSELNRESPEGPDSYEAYMCSSPAQARKLADELPFRGVDCRREGTVLYVRGRDVARAEERFAQVGERVPLPIRPSAEEMLGPGSVILRQECKDYLVASKMARALAREGLRASWDEDGTLLCAYDKDRPEDYARAIALMETMLPAIIKEPDKYPPYQLGSVEVESPGLDMGPHGPDDPNANIPEVERAVAEGSATPGQLDYLMCVLEDERVPQDIRDAIDAKGLEAMSARTANEFVLAASRYMPEHMRIPNVEQLREMRAAYESMQVAVRESRGQDAGRTNPQLLRDSVEAPEARPASQAARGEMPSQEAGDTFGQEPQADTPDKGDASGRPQGRPGMSLSEGRRAQALAGSHVAITDASVVNGQTHAAQVAVADTREAAEQAAPADWSRSQLAQDVPGNRDADGDGLADMAEDLNGDSVPDDHQDLLNRAMLGVYEDLGCGDMAFHEYVTAHGGHERMTDEEVSRALEMYDSGSRDYGAAGEGISLGDHGREQAEPELGEIEER